MAVRPVRNSSDGAREVTLLVPHATAAIAPTPKSIRANSAGTIALRAVGSSVDVSLTVVAGEVLRIAVQYIRVAGTTVTAIHGLS